MQSKQPKAVGGKTPAQPHQTREQHHKTDISGTVNVLGKIETSLPPDTVKQRDAEDKKKEKRDKNRFIVECVGLLFVVVYAGLTAVQAWVSWQALEAVRQANSLTIETARGRYSLALTDLFVPWTNTGELAYVT